MNFFSLSNFVTFIFLTLIILIFFFQEVEPFKGRKVKLKSPKVGQSIAQTTTPANSDSPSPDEDHPFDTEDPDQENENYEYRCFFIEECAIYQVINISSPASRSASALASNCYYKLKNGVIQPHCVNEAMNISVEVPDIPKSLKASRRFRRDVTSSSGNSTNGDGEDDEDTTSSPDNNNNDDDDDDDDDNKKEPNRPIEPKKFCPAAQKTFDCINDYACSLCTYEEAVAFNDLRKSWFKNITTSFCFKSDTPPPSPSPLCQDNLVKEVSTPKPTWAPAIVVPPNRTSVYLFFGVLGLVLLTFLGIFVLMYTKKSEPLVLEKEEKKKFGQGKGVIGEQMLLVDAGLKNTPGGQKAKVLATGSSAKMSSKNGLVGGVSCFSVKPPKIGRASSIKEKGGKKDVKKKGSVQGGSKDKKKVRSKVSKDAKKSSLISSSIVGSTNKNRQSSTQSVQSHRASSAFNGQQKKKESKKK